MSIKRILHARLVGIINAKIWLLLISSSKIDLKQKSNIIFISQVQFIDYGNIEICNFEDLRKADIFRNIPIQSNRYCISGVQPLLRSSKRRWTVNVTDFVHSQIVDELCSFRVGYNPLVLSTVIPCAITAKGFDLKSLLVHNDMVRPVT